MSGSLNAGRPGPNETSVAVEQVLMLVCQLASVLHPALINCCYLNYGSINIIFFPCFLVFDLTRTFAESLSILCQIGLTGTP